MSLTTELAVHAGHVLDTAVGDEIGPDRGRPALSSAKIDSRAAADTYFSAILDEALRRGRSESAIAVIEEEFNSPCTKGMAAFDRFIECASRDH
jgi:arsenite-transporting ATPase